MRKIKRRRLVYETIVRWTQQFVYLPKINSCYFFRHIAHSVFVVDKWSQQVHDLSIKIFNKAP